MTGSPEAPSTARLLHPSNDRGHAPVSIAVLHDIAAGLASTFPPPTGHLRRGEIRRHRLLGTAGYDAWLVEFGPHAAVEPHDHDGSIGVTCVIEGQLLELHADQSGQRRSSLRQIGTGDTIELGITHHHLLMNSTTQVTRAVQAFSPPLGRD